MCSILIVGYVEKEGVEHVPERREVVVSGLADDGRECCGRGGEEGGDLLRGHSRRVVLCRVCCDGRRERDIGSDMRICGSGDGRVFHGDCVVSGALVLVCRWCTP